MFSSNTREMGTVTLVGLGTMACLVVYFAVWLAVALMNVPGFLMQPGAQVTIALAAGAFARTWWMLAAPLVAWSVVILFGLGLGADRWPPYDWDWLSILWYLGMAWITITVVFFIGWLGRQTVRARRREE